MLVLALKKYHLLDKLQHFVYDHRTLSYEAERKAKVVPSHKNYRIHCTD